MMFQSFYKLAELERFHNLAVVVAVTVEVLLDVVLVVVVVVVTIILCFQTSKPV